MKSILFAALFTIIFATVNAATSTTLVQQPSGIVCAQTVCPTYTQALEKRATPTCPSTCPDNCSIIDDVCCPGVQKAVCNSSSTTAGVATNTGAVTTATSTSSVVSSGVSSVAPTSASVSSPVATATSTTNTSNANTVQYMLSVTITMMFITSYLLQ